MEDIKLGFVAKDMISEGGVCEEDVKLIRNFVTTEKLPNLTDEQLIAFLISCENNQEAAKKTILEYCSIKKTLPEIFYDRDIARDDVQRQLQTSRYCVFPKRTEDGCVIVYIKLNDTNYANYEMAPAVKMLFMTFDAAVYDRPPTGLIMLMDVKGAGLMHLTKVKLHLIKPCLHYAQEAMPLRIKCVHVLNIVYFLSRILSLCRQFIKDEVFKNVRFHMSGIDMEDFYTNCIPRECLPEEYGGYLPSIDILHEENKRKCLNMKKFFFAEEEELKKYLK